jgi:formylglycine-generating enzyme required for sulfatase activity
MSHVFISYSKKNKDYARRLADYLLENGFDVWIDDRIDYGENWLDTMFRAVCDCAAFVVIMTPEAQQSRWVQREVAWADEREKPFFPVLLDGENWPVFVLTQYADARDGHLPNEQFLEELAEHVPISQPLGKDVASHAELEQSSKPISTEVQRLLHMMLNPKSSPLERAEAGRQIAELGDPRPGVGLRPDSLPDIDWVEIPAGEFIYQAGERFSLPTFFIARYPITYGQFQAFLDASDGFECSEWWIGLTPEHQKRRMSEQYFKYKNRPRDNVTWYQAVAYSRWLSAKLGYEVRLPTEQEWEKTARGTDGHEFPWGNKYISGYANIDELDSFGMDHKAGEYFVGQTTTVGIYPQGASSYGVLDMAGNVWEWCLNKHSESENISLEGEAERILRGGSWRDDVRYARCTVRSWYKPDGGGNYRGFRVVCSVPIG